MKSPLKAKPLHNPGDSVQKAINDLVYDKILTYLLFTGFFFFMSVMDWQRYLFNKPINPWVATYMAIGSLLLCVYKVVRTMPTIRQMKLGRDGERVVGQFLERLRESGAKVFHDVPGDGFNLDHVVIAASGIYVVETKTYSKPDAGEPTITFDGTRVTLRERGTFEAPVIQAKAGARWLRELLLESTSKQFPVRPVLVFPGWFVQPSEQARSSEVWVLNPKALPSFIGNSSVSLTPDEMALANFHLSRYVRNYST